MTWETAALSQSSGGRGGRRGWSHAVGVTYHLQLTFQGCRLSTLTEEPEGAAGARGVTAAGSQGPLRQDSEGGRAGPLFVKQ